MMYDTLIFEPLREMVTQVINFIPTLVIALAILIIGTILARLLKRAVLAFFKAIDLDKMADKVGIAHILKKGGIAHKSSELISSLIYWVAMVMVLLLTVKAFGMSVASSLLDRLLAYIPDVIAGVLILILGMLLAKVISGLVYVAASNTDIPQPEVLSRLSKYAIVGYVAIIFLKEVGFESLFVGTNGMIFFGGVVFALALAFGLGGKDIAAKYLDVLKKTNHK